MQIDKIYLINFEHRWDRYYAFLGTACQHRIPFSMIERFEPMLDSEECDSVEKVAKLMVKDGFEAWSWMLFNKTWMHPTVLAVFWSKLSCLRLVRDVGKTALIMSDSSFISRNFIDFEDMIVDFPEIELLNLMFRFENLEDENFIFHEYLVGMNPTDSPYLYSNYVGLGTSAMAMTSDFADILIKFWSQHPNMSWAWIFYQMGKERDMSKSFVCIPSVADTHAHYAPDYPFVLTDKKDGSGVYVGDKEF